MAVEKELILKDTRERWSALKARIIPSHGMEIITSFSLSILISHICAVLHLRVRI